MSFRPLPRDSTGATLQRVLSFMRTATLPRLRALAFWLAVGLPWALLAFVLAGYASQRPVLLAALLTGSVLCSVAGQDYAHR